MAFRYNEGDIVIVRCDIVDDGRKYCMDNGGNSDVVADGMLKYRGMPVTIDGYEQNKYLIKEDRGLYYWTDEMFISEREIPDVLDEEPNTFLMGL